MEICLNDAWGTVCGRNWNTTEADVACRQLGLAGICQILMLAMTCVRVYTVIHCKFVVYIAVCLLLCRLHLQCISGWLSRRDKNGSYPCLYK